MAHIDADLLLFLGHFGAAVAAQAQAQLLLGVRQNDEIHALPAAGRAVVLRPQPTWADIHHMAQPVDREGLALFFPSRDHAPHDPAGQETNLNLTAFGSQRTGCLPEKHLRATG